MRNATSELGSNPTHTAGVQRQQQSHHAYVDVQSERVWAARDCVGVIVSRCCRCNQHAQGWQTEENGSKGCTVSRWVPSSRVCVQLSPPACPFAR